MKITKFICKNCEIKLTTEHAKGKYVFYCSDKCYNEKQEKDKQKRLENWHMHDPRYRRMMRGESIEPAWGTPSVKNKPATQKTGRKCGNCGERGHNKRTCKK